MDDRKQELDARGRRAKERRGLLDEREELIHTVLDTLAGKPSHEELAATAAKLHAAHAAHEAQAGHADRAEAARQRERRARNRAGD
jgi:hypothetical protein